MSVNDKACNDGPSEFAMRRLAQSAYASVLALLLAQASTDDLRCVQIIQATASLAGPIIAVSG